MVNTYLFIFIIAVILLVIYSKNIPAILLTFAAAVLFTFLFKKEYLEKTRIPDNKTVDDDLNLNIDDIRYSEYGNISEQKDIDSFKQRSADFKFNKSSEIDNSNIVDDVISGFSSNFQPNNAQGVSTTTYAPHSHFKLAESNPHLKGVDYSVPLNETGYNLDQALARKQQHRSSINKRAIDGAVRSTKNIFQRFFNNELNENEEKTWWSAESDVMETDFRHF